nr:MAG TPA: N-deoxyribosyltransferase [Bacteriophage sp.]
MAKDKAANNNGNNSSKKTCFFITPIGTKDSEEFKKLEGISINVIEPILEKHGYQLIVAHKIKNIGSIGDQVFKNILDADLVISNLTGLNPNVMYETAVSHSFGVPTIMICETETKLPFDIIEERTIFFDNTIAGSGELKIGIDEKIEELLKDGTHDNPVYRVIQRTNIISEVSKGEKVNADEAILEMLFEMQDSISRLEKRSRITNMANRESVINKNYNMFHFKVKGHSYNIYLKNNLPQGFVDRVISTVVQLTIDLERLPAAEEIASELDLPVEEIRKVIGDIVRS